MKSKRLVRCSTIPWKIAVAPNDYEISGKDLAMTSLKSLMDAPTRMRRQSLHGWNANALISSISSIPIVQHGWYPRQTSCTTRAQFWLSFDDTASTYSSGSVEKKTAKVGIIERCSPHFGSMATMQILSTNLIVLSARSKNSCVNIEEYGFARLVVKMEARASLSPPS